MLRQFRGDSGKKLGSDRLVHQQGLHGVADGGPLDFGIHRYVLRHLQIRFAIDIDMANAFIVFDHRNFRALSDCPDETFAAARHTKVHILCERQ